MSNVKLTGSNTFDSQILMHSITQNNDFSLAKEFQKICLRSIGNMVSLIRSNAEKEPVKENRQT